MPVVTIKQFLKPGFLEKIVRDSVPVARAVDKVIKRRVAGLKGVTMQEFDRHPVTKEIQAGANSTNVSNTLGGKGNLFTFIGFYNSTDPIGPVREVLKSNLNLVSRQKAKRGTKGVEFYRYQLTIPTLESFRLVARMPWESGNSWVIGVERGISGFSNYMYFTRGGGRFSGSSRSGKALQSKKAINAGTFSPTLYMTEILNNYRNRLRG
ncbi:MAG TPA: hypothetical protein EYG21_00915 [Nitrospinaceae bacterium]|nr:hypothetical protein [Nitrospinaceae bacterium]